LRGPRVLSQAQLLEESQKNKPSCVGLGGGKPSRGEKNGESLEWKLDNLNVKNILSRIYKIPGDENVCMKAYIKKAALQSLNQRAEKGGGKTWLRREMGGSRSREEIRESEMGELLATYAGAFL